MQEDIMPQFTYDRIAELHNLAEHAHFAASAAHNAGDHATAHELSRRAMEHSMDAYRRSEEMMQKMAVSNHQGVPVSKLAA
jgi:hypothetical protein